MGIKVAGISMLAALALVGAASAQERPDLDSSWKQIANGVFQKEEADGSITRMAYGAAGARYDRKIIEARMRTLENLRANGTASKAELAENADLTAALNGIPSKFEGGNPSPMTTMSGQLCGGVFYYGLDAHFVTGSVGATVVTRAGLADPPFGPPVYFDSGTVYARSTVTPQGQSAITVTRSAAVQPTQAGITAVADWNAGYATLPPYPTNACTGSSYAYVQFTSQQACTTNPQFVSQTKSYSTCASSP